MNAYVFKKYFILAEVVQNVFQSFCATQDFFSFI